ncbi:MAG: class I SAM-dependent methyltransferase [Candidatus Daviesbacteria bacterium]|nr:MAG: class I SAM-dependent methyltransferase [Candidatus Daviesbacteria bacterium]
MKLLIKCPICQTNSWQKYSLKLVICNNCSFIRAKDTYFRVNAIKLYGQEYFNESDYGDYAQEEEALVKNFTDRVRRIRQYKKSGKLLEIGCAYGYFLKLAQKYYQCSGIDLNPEVTKIAQKTTKAKIITGDFLNLNIPKNSFDIVCMFDTIEHLKYPAQYLSKISQILKPNGIVVVETGDIGSFLAKIQGNGWRLITPPFHLQYFSQKTLTRLFENSQLSVIDVNRVSFYRSIRQIIYKLANNKHVLDSSHPLLSKTIPINTYDLLFVVAQKN